MKRKAPHLLRPQMFGFGRSLTPPGLGFASAQSASRHSRWGEASAETTSRLAALGRFLFPFRNEYAPLAASMTGLEKEDSHLIAFVLSAFAARAIDAADIRRWADGIFSQGGTYPHYLLELCWFDGRLRELYDAIGFTPCWPDGLGDRNALEAFAFRRGIIPFEANRSQEEAEGLLRANPQIATAFKEAFPWLNNLAGAAEAL